jgi:hypothetical protein
MKQAWHGSSPLRGGKRCLSFATVADVLSKVRTSSTAHATLGIFAENAQWLIFVGGCLTVSGIRICFSFVRRSSEMPKFCGNQPHIRRKNTMATAPATPVTTIKPQRKMVEAKAPEQFQFNKQGQTIEGVLLKIEETTVKEKPALEYTLQTSPTDRLTFLGTANLDKKIRPDYLGHFLSIRYERDDSSFQKPGQSAMKIFRVMVSEEREPGH